MYSLSIVLPCYNEAANVERVARAALAVAEQTTSEYEVIVVDDGSRDETARIAERLRDEDSAHMRVIHHATNRGYGAALVSGFRAASKELVFFTDGDGQFDLDELPRLIPLIEQHHIVAGFRIHRKDPFVRAMYARSWGALVNALFGLHVRDLNCAFKLYRRQVFEHMTLASTGASINAEIFAKAARLGYTTVEVGVQHFPRIAGQQTGANVKVIVRAFRELLALRRAMKS